MRHQRQPCACVLQALVRDFGDGNALSLTESCDNHAQRVDDQALAAVSAACLPCSGDIHGVVDRACAREHVIADAGGLARTNLPELNRSLRRNINSARGYCPPIELARRLAV